MKRLFLLFVLTCFALLLFGQQTITVTSPNGGENWLIGSMHNITWISSSTEGSFNIQLRRGANNNEYLTMAQNIPVTAGTFAWTIPTTVTPGTEYKIRISRITANGTIIQDYSDNYFGITGNTPPPAQITVTAPNGGESWVIGTMHPITWNAAGIDGNVCIQLRRGFANNEYITVATDVPFNQGSFNWTLPTTLQAGSEYKIRVFKPSNTTTPIQDYSDNFFTIIANTPPEASLTVTAPNGGETWVKGTNHPITWTSQNLTGHVQIFVQRGANSTVPYYMITQDAENNGSFNWTVPTTLAAGSEYKVGIRSLQNNAVVDYSNAYFTIAEYTPPARVINITSPNGGEVWQRGTTHAISWTGSNMSGNVLLQLVRGAQNQIVTNIAGDVPATAGSFNWTIPTAMTIGNEYKIKVSMSNPNGVAVTDYSNAYFTISEGTVPPTALTLLSPNGGESWVRGSMHTITWSCAMLSGMVNIQLVRGANNNPVMTIAENVFISNGSFNWTIPATLESGNEYKVRVFSANSTTLTDISDGYFAITGRAVSMSVFNAPGGSGIKITGSDLSKTSLKVYNLKGQYVATIADNANLTANHNLVWNQQDNQHHSVKAGVYFLKLDAREASLTQKLIISR